MKKESSRGKIKNILVVDDEVEITKTLVRHLKREGFCLDACNTVAEAQQKIVIAAQQGNHFDLVISDLIMPGQDGLELVEWIKGSQPMISIMLISGHGDVDLLDRAIRPELDTFTFKPLTPNKVMALITKIGNKRQAKQGISL